MRQFKALTTFVVAAALLAGTHAKAQSNVVTAWPLTMQSPSGNIEVYEPQSESFTGDLLTARAAVSVTPAGAAADQPVFGAIWFSARVSTDRDARVVTILDMQVRKVVFPTSDEAQQAQLSAVVQNQLPQLNVTFSLDQLMTGLDQAQKEKIESQKLSTAPPKVIFSTHPATLVTIDGEPKLQPIIINDQPNGVLRVVNTPFIILLDSSKQYFLKAGGTWLVAPDVKGPWANATNVPANVIASSTTLTDSSAGQTPPADTPGPISVYVAQEPTELVVTNGAPTYTPLPGNDLLYMSNTESDVFMAVQSQTYYVLLSGRWFSSRSLNGPWGYNAPDSLPPAFAQIPADSPKAHVLASVAGTPAAQDAKLDAVIPQTAAIPMNAPGPDVTYDGEPVFQPCEGTEVTYAANSPYSVVCAEGGYYCCDQAVWYTSSRPRGPWRVCVRVPGSIYLIPPSCPVYNCRYVYCYRSTPEVVYMGYLPGYTGCYVFGGTVVYGTGYRYPAWYHTYYVPRPYTYGFATRYDPYRGVWGYGYNDHWDNRWFARSEHQEVVHTGWFGPRGYVGYRSLAAERGGNVDIHQNNSVHITNVTVNRATVERLNLYQHPTNNQRGVRVTQQVTEVHTPHAKASDDNVFAGRDGQVYRRTDQGWEQRSRSGWDHVNEPSGAKPLNGRDAGDNRNKPVDVRPSNGGIDRTNVRTGPQHDQDQPDKSNKPVDVRPSNGGVDRTNVHTTPLHDTDPTDNRNKPVQIRPSDGGNDRTNVQNSPQKHDADQPDNRNKPVQARPSDNGNDHTNVRTAPREQPTQQPRESSPSRSSDRGDIDADRSSRERGASRANDFGQRYGGSSDSPRAESPRQESPHAEAPRETPHTAAPSGGGGGNNGGGGASRGNGGGGNGAGGGGSSGSSSGNGRGNNR